MKFSYSLLLPFKPRDPQANYIQTLHTYLLRSNHSLSMNNNDYYLYLPDIILIYTGGGANNLVCISDISFNLNHCIPCNPPALKFNIPIHHLVTSLHPAANISCEFYLTHCSDSQLVQVCKYFTLINHFQSINIW